MSVSTARRPIHAWLRPVRAAFVPGPATPLLREVWAGLADRFRRDGHEVLDAPDDRTDIAFTSAPFAEPISWRTALLFTARSRFHLKRSPAICTLVHATPAALDALLDRLAVALEKERPDPTDYAFPGLAPEAYRVLHEQARRAGPILALERLVQAQAKSIRVVLVVGDEHPVHAYHFDLVGAHPRSDAADPEAFYEDIVLRLVTAVSTEDTAEHMPGGPPLSLAEWQGLTTPAGMTAASEEFGLRGFFTEPVRVGGLVPVPALTDAVASQYSEGCFATWEPALGGLLTTITGSARPLDKGKVTQDDLAVVIGVRPDGKGTFVRQVEGLNNAPPSSEAVEMMIMDSLLPRVTLGPPWSGVSAPAMRSKLHGHRGIVAFDPDRVEYVALDPAYHHYPVACGSAAQAQAVQLAFGRSQALRNADDRRSVVFTVLPGHGIIVTERWAEGKVPFQLIWEEMDAGSLEITGLVPQGPFHYGPGRGSRLTLREGADPPG